MASNTIYTLDGKHHYIDKDSHFRDLIREYMGNNAAEWYEDRIHSIDNIHDFLTNFLPNTDSLRAIHTALNKLSLGQWEDLLYALDELRGWDE